MKVRSCHSFASLCLKLKMITDGNTGHGLSRCAPSSVKRLRIGQHIWLALTPWRTAAKVMERLCLTNGHPAWCLQQVNWLFPQMGLFKNYSTPVNRKTHIFLTVGKEVAESWYKENVKYNFATPGFQNGTGRLFILHSYQLKSLIG